MSSIYKVRKPVSRALFSLTLSVFLVFGCVYDAADIRGIRHPEESVKLVTISSVRVESQDDGLHVAITGSEPLSYSIRKSDQPLHLTLDMPQARFVGLPEVLTVAQGGVKAIHLSHVQGATATARLELHLETQVPYSVAQEGERLVVRFPSPARNASPAQDAAKQQVAFPTLPPSSQDYCVGPKDVITITVYDEPDLSKKLRVSERGFITFPLVGIVQVQGLTPEQIAETLEDLLFPRYLLNPQVMVEVAEFESQKVFILGAVDKPTSFTLRGTTTLLELLSETDRFNRGDGVRQIDSLVVFRHMAPEEAQGNPTDYDVQTIRIDLNRLLRQGDMSLNLVLQAHDVVYIPEAGSVFVFGEVRQPGPIPLPEGGMTLVEAMSKAGGPTPFAILSRTKVFRVVNGEERTLRINMSDVLKRGDRSKDTMLQADDIVVIPKSIF